MAGLSLLLLAALQVADCAPPAVRAGSVVDVETGLGVADAVVQSRVHEVRTAPDGRFTVTAAGCDTLRVRRLGFRARVYALTGPGPVTIAIRRSAVPLDAVETSRTALSPAQAVVSGDAADARRLGGSTAADLAATLPFVGVRTVAGRTALSLRGSRAEQVLVTLDGIPLSDPATGAADLSDIPLALLAGAAASLGSGAAEHGSGASGGVIALHSGSDPFIGVQAGSYGNRTVEGAWASAGSRGRVRIGGALATASDDFTFRNVAAAAPADTVERRVNNDSRRASAFVAAALDRVQLLLLHTDTERGLVGPMNVRAFDQDRGRTARTLGRLSTAVGRVEMQASAQVLAARYESRGETQPAFTIGARSGSLVAALPLGPVALRSGFTLEHVEGSTLPAAARASAFAAGTVWRAVRAFRVTGALRADVVERSAGQLSPSVTLERAGPVTLSVRVAQGFRVPTFYDLHFASPQRITSQPLVPERVTLDAELRASADRGCGVDCRVLVAASIFERRTTDAIVWFPGNVGWSPQNVPRERARGGEAHVAGERRGVGAKLWGGVYHTLLSDGFLEMRTPYVPYWSGGAAVTAGGDALGVRLQVSHTGRRPFTTGPALAELELPPATLVAAGLQRRQQTAVGALALSLSVDDLLDSRPELVRRHPTAGRQWTLGLSLIPRSR